MINKDSAFLVLFSSVFVLCFSGCGGDEELSLSELVLGSWSGGYILVNDFEYHPSGSFFVAMDVGVLTFSSGGRFGFVATCSLKESNDGVVVGRVLSLLLLEIMMFMVLV